MKVLQKIFMFLFLVIAGYVAKAQVAFSVNGLYSIPTTDLQDEGYRDGVGLNADLMFSPLGPAPRYNYRSVRILRWLKPEVNQRNFVGKISIQRSGNINCAIATSPWNLKREG